MKIGIIGAGGISHAHLTGYAESELVDVICIADPNETAKKIVSERFNIEKTVSNYEELLDDKTIDIIDICLPHYLHRPVAVAAMESGKDVICEKPIATTLEDADAMIEASKRLGKRLYISHNQLFMPANAKAKTMLEEGRIGKPFLAIFNIIGNEFARMNDAKSWKGTWDKAGGGALIDTGMHAVYVIQSFFGEPQAVTAVTRRLLVELEDKADDNSVVCLEFENGVLGNIVVTYTALAHPWDERRNVYGTEGSLHIADSGENPLTFVGQNGREAVPVEKHEQYNPHLLSIVRSVNHFLDCLVNDQEFATTPEEGRSALQTILAAYSSARKGEKIGVV